MDEQELRKKLTPEEYRILRERGTEAPFSGEYVSNHQEGVYRCKVCNTELFASGTKFDSGTGWPSFTDPANTEHIKLITDSSHGMERTEVRCAECDSHLGHVFMDGPKVMPNGSKASGARYCINSACLQFERIENRE